MGVVFYIAGAGLAAFAGYSGLDWYFIFIAALLMAIGWFFTRAPQLHGEVSEKGSAVILKLLPMQIIGYSIITAPVYFVASYSTLFHSYHNKPQRTNFPKAYMVLSRQDLGKELFLSRSGPS